MQPVSLVQAVAYARLQEEKLLDVRRSSSQRFSTLTVASRPPASTLMPPLLSTPQKTQNSTIPFKRLSPEELARRREKGLCFQCDEKFSRGHKCSSSLFLLIADDEDTLPDVERNPELPPEPPELPPKSPPAQLSLHALSGHSAPETLRMKGTINDLHVSILIDGGSTHNFLHHRVVTALKLPTQDIASLRVTVGNGDEIRCQQRCGEVTVQIQRNSFTIDFHILPLGGADVVLGVQWLKTLGPILTDYTSLNMKFIMGGKLIELKGDRERDLEQVTPSQLRRLLHTNPTSSFFHIRLDKQTPPQTATHMIPEIASLVTKYSSLFQPPTNLPPSRSTDHSITLLPNTTPVNVKPYRYPYFQKQEIEEQVNAMLEKGFIQPSSSPFSSPVLLVKKKDGGWRFCVDYRALNAVTVRDRFPIPMVDELLDELGRARWFLKLDLMHGYHQILMREEDISKTAFRTHQGHYKFRVMPFGLCNAPSSFQSTMNELFRPCLRKYIIVFFDDILIYSKTISDHLLHLESAFRILVAGQFSLKLSKCMFAQEKLEYLGHVVAGDGVRPVPEKIRTIHEWPIPKTPKAQRGFFGLAGFYRRFIKGYSTLAAPLTKLLCHAQFQWSTVATEAFQKLKEALMAALVLALPNFHIPFIVETDASGSGIGVVLTQEGHPISFFSKQFCTKLMNASTYVRELAAITATVKKWRQYLLGHKFIIVTDHMSLRELMDQTVQTPEQHRYLARLLGYYFTIQYRAGRANIVADALSRIHEEPSASLSLISMPQFEFLEDLRKEVASNLAFMELSRKIHDDPYAHPEYTFTNDLILHKGRIWIPSDSSFTKLLLEEFHQSPTGGHMGVQKTLHRLQENFTWDSIQMDTHAFIARCLTCQCTKYDNKKPAGLLSPLPVPVQPWEDLSMDFIVGLPTYKGHTCIFVVVDRFSKGLRLGMLPTQHNARTVASLFMDIVGRLHGMPRSIVSDRDPLFVSRFWKELFSLSGTKLCLSSAYHPQSDGQTEVANRIIEQYLRAFVHQNPS